MPKQSAILRAPHVFAGLRFRHYRFIYADPATKFVGGTKSRPQHYDRMTDEEIAALPVADLMHPEGCWLGLWATSPRLYRPMGSKKRLRPDEIADRWGKFRYSARGWLFIKVRGGQHVLFVHAKNIHRGSGLTTAKNAEDLLLFKRGSPPVKSRAEFEIVFAPIREHSRKPDEMYEKIETFAAGPYVELFARGGGEPRRNWAYWGDQLGTFR